MSLEVIYLDEMKEARTFTKTIPVLWKAFAKWEQDQLFRKKAIKELEVQDVRKMKRKASQIVEEILEKWEKDTSLTTVVETIAKEEKIAPWNVLKSIKSLSSILKEQGTLEEEQKQSLMTLQAKVEQANPPKYNYTQQEQYWSYQIAEETITRFLKAQPKLLSDFYKESNCRSEVFLTCVAIIENKNPRLFEEYCKAIKAKKEKTNETISKNEKNTKKEKVLAQMEELRNASKEEITVKLMADPSYVSAFCNLFGLKESEFHCYVGSNVDRLREIVEVDFVKKKEIIHTYMSALKKEVLHVANMMYQKLLEEKNKKSSEILPFDLYDYAKNGTIEIKDLSTTAGKAKVPNAEKVIRCYMNKHASIFFPIEERRLAGYGNSGYMNCDDYIIQFTRDEFKRALQDIRENNLPTYRGVLFGAILKQKELSQGQPKVHVKRESN